MFRLESGNTNAAAGYLALARQYEVEGRIAHALDAYRKAAQASPADPDVLNTQGLALARHAQFGPAVMALRQAVAMAPERAQLLNNLGYALLLDGRSEEARAIFRLTLAVEPTHEMASRNLAYVDEQLAAAAATIAGPRATAVHAVAVSMGTEVAARATESAEPLPPLERTPALAQERAAAPAVEMSADIRTAAPARMSLDGVSIEIVNGNGINGAAARIRQLLRERGVVVRRLANRLPYNSPHTQVLYHSGNADAAHELAQRMPVHVVIGPAPAGSTQAHLSVLLGHDIRHGAGCALLNACVAGPERLAGSGAQQLLDTGASIETRR